MTLKLGDSMVRERAHCFERSERAPVGVGAASVEGHQKGGREFSVGATFIRRDQNSMKWCPGRDSNPHFLSEIQF